MSQLVSAAINGETSQPEDLSGPPAANRHRLPDERTGLTHHFSIAATRATSPLVFIRMGRRGEIFIRMAKEGSTPPCQGVYLRPQVQGEVVQRGGRAPGAGTL
jgi:hypothetical protein